MLYKAKKSKKKRSKLFCVFVDGRRLRKRDDDEKEGNIALYANI